jgi:Fe-S cluster biogenesis protein NfuA
MSNIDQIKANIRTILETEIKPNLQMHGGDVTFEGYDDNGIVHVSLKGACQGCPGAVLTLKHTVEEHLKSKVPEVKAVQHI